MAAGRPRKLPLQTPGSQGGAGPTAAATAHLVGLLACHLLSKPGPQRQQAGQRLEDLAVPLLRRLAVVLDNLR